MVTHTPSPPQPRVSGPRSTSDLAVVVCSALVALATAMAVVHRPDDVAAVTVTNPTEYLVRVEVRAAADPAWRPLATVARGVTRTTTEVVDAGETWVFRFTVQGAASVEVSRTRAELDAAGWQLPVPEDAAAAWRAAGLPPSPCPASDGLAPVDCGPQ
jgi:hypothetical protein